MQIGVTGKKDSTRLSFFCYTRKSAPLHKAHLINTMFIRSFHKNDGGYLQLTDGTSIPVSRRRKDEILTRLKHL